MNFFSLLKYMGIEIPIFFSGVSGAIVFLTKNGKMSKVQQFLTILSGGLSANYLTPMVADLLNLDNKVLYGIAFLLGFSGMKSVEAIVGYFNNKIKKQA